MLQHLLEAVSACWGLASPVSQRRTTRVYVFWPLSFRSGSDSSPNCRRWSGGPRTDDQIRFGSRDGNLVCACLSASSSSPKTPVLPICVTTCLRTPTLSGSHLHFLDHKWATLLPPRPCGSSSLRLLARLAVLPALFSLDVVCLHPASFHSSPFSSSPQSSSCPLNYLFILSIRTPFFPFLLICCVHSLGS